LSIGRATGWRATSTTGAPIGRATFSRVDGLRMIVWEDVTEWGPPVTKVEDGNGWPYSPDDDSLAT